ncbi:MAG: MBL fold metallo-hydrolase, partial [Lachnospira sp.]|nr:MBL fold metallo-hydrolase [Lachnospira sp.]
ATFTIIAPNKNYEESNNASIGIILHYGQKSFLFTGDAETDSEMDIIAGGINIKCDVYKAGHHGSKSSSCAALLNAASPAYAVISCGKNNDYGHPHTQTINQFTQRGIKIFRTDEHGSVVAVTDGKDIKWMCERGY